MSDHTGGTTAEPDKTETGRNNPDISAADKTPYSRHRIVYGVFVACVLLMVGYISVSSSLHRSATAARSPSLARTDLGNGSVRYETEGDLAFALTLPGSWHAIALDPQWLTQEEKEPGSMDTGLVQWLQDPDTKKALECCGRLIAYDPASTDRTIVLTVMTFPLRDGETLASTADAWAANLNAQPDSTETVKKAPVAHQAGEAYSLTMERTTTLDSGEDVVFINSQLDFEKDGQVLSIIFTVVASDRDKVERETGLIRQIGDSFAWR